MTRCRVVKVRVACEVGTSRGTGAHDAAAAVVAAAAAVVVVVYDDDSYLIDRGDGSDPVVRYRYHPCCCERYTGKCGDSGYW